jgi:hypothetical protein
MPVPLVIQQYDVARPAREDGVEIELARTASFLISFRCFRALSLALQSPPTDIHTFLQYILVVHVFTTWAPARILPTPFSRAVPLISLYAHPFLSTDRPGERDFARRAGVAVERFFSCTLLYLTSNHEKRGMIAHHPWALVLLVNFLISSTNYYHGPSACNNNSSYSNSS